MSNKNYTTIKIRTTTDSSKNGLLTYDDNYNLIFHYNPDLLLSKDKEARENFFKSMLVKAGQFLTLEAEVAQQLQVSKGHLDA